MTQECISINEKLQEKCKDILPCPFCGSSAEIESSTFAIEYFRVICTLNGHKIDWWEEDKDTAIAVWNERNNN